jgi:uncharacterized protein (DUF302 family)
MLNPTGVVINVSPFSVNETVSRLIELLKNKKATIYTVIDQRDELAKAGITIPPMQFVLFGNPKSGGTLMVENPVAGLDLPLKVLVWEDENNNVRVAYNDPGYLLKRYGLCLQLGAILDLKPVIKMALDIR